MHKTLLSFLLFFGILTACVSTTTTPNKEYALAHTALLTAKQFEADKLSSKNYMKALSLYKRAVSLYKKQSYEEARSFFEESIPFAEKAEFKARLKTMKESK